MPLKETFLHNSMVRNMMTDNQLKQSWTVADANALSY